MQQTIAEKVLAQRTMPTGDLSTVAPSRRIGGVRRAMLSRFNRHHCFQEIAGVAFPLDLERAARRYRKYAPSGTSGLTVTVARPDSPCRQLVPRRGCHPAFDGKRPMEAAILLLALAAPGQHPVKLDATLLSHELRLFGDGFRRGCGPDCYRCRSCDGLGRCYDYRGAFGYPWNPRHSRCVTVGYEHGGTPLTTGHPLPPVVIKIDPAWQPPPWNPAEMPPTGPLPHYLPEEELPPAELPPSQGPYLPAAAAAGETPALSQRPQASMATSGSSRRTQQ